MNKQTCKHETGFYYSRCRNCGNTVVCENCRRLFDEKQFPGKKKLVKMSETSSCGGCACTYMTADTKIAVRL